LSALKTKQRATWASGDYAVIGVTLQLVGETLCEAVDVAAGERVLDVACGNGNASLAAARRGARTTGADYVPELLAKAGKRAAAEGLDITFVEADAEALPFADASFDTVLSTFGVMFTPNPERAAGELLRVCRPGGKIGLTNWTPEGFIGELLKTVGRHVPPPAGVRSPSLWGTREQLMELFGAHCSSLQIQRRAFVFRYESREHFIATFRAFYGPMHKAFAALDDAGQEALTADLHALLARHDRGQGRALTVPSEYIEVVVSRH
jgi:ubiquinone/menaquinone biosynthesis C-methylase UbiE